MWQSDNAVVGVVDVICPTIGSLKNNEIYNTKHSNIVKNLKLLFYFTLLCFNCSFFNNKKMQKKYFDISLNFIKISKVFAHRYCYLH